MSHRTLREHLDAILALVEPLAPATLPVSSAIEGHIIATDATARLPIPPFSNSAMDGFLVHSADLAGEGPWTLPVAGEVPAGAAPLAVPEGAALRIMTGAPVGDDNTSLQVIPVELTDAPAGPSALPDSVTIATRPERRHIRGIGEHLAAGGVAVPAGTAVDPGTLAALISSGVTDVDVVPLPRVAVVSTGAELVSAVPGQPTTLGPGQLPDSNGPMVAALVRDVLPRSATAGQGVATVTQTHAGDTVDELRATLDALASTHDLIITTGGVSAGAFDVVHTTLGESGPEAWFGHVNHKPGAPQGMARWQGTPVLCLPGNPVAAFVAFHLYAQPALRVLRGIGKHAAVDKRPNLRATATTEFPGARGRTAIVPVVLEYGPDGVTATPFNERSLGSHLVASLAGTHGLAIIDGDAPHAGDDVHVLLY